MQDKSTSFYFTLHFLNLLHSFTIGAQQNTMYNLKFQSVLNDYKYLHKLDLQLFALPSTCPFMLAKFTVNPSMTGVLTNRALCSAGLPKLTSKLMKYIYIYIFAISVKILKPTHFFLSGAAVTILYMAACPKSAYLYLTSVVYWIEYSVLNCVWLALQLWSVM